MSVRALSWVFEQSPVRHRGDLLVLLVLADHARDDGTGSYPSVATIARKARLSRRGVFDALERLKAEGAISPDGRGPKGTISYSIHFRGGAVTAPRAVIAPVQSAAPGGAVTAPGGVQCPAPEPSLNRSEPSPPTPPTGGRARDRARFDEEMRAWAQAHFPDIDVGYVTHAIDKARRAQLPLTTESLRPLIERWQPNHEEQMTMPTATIQ